MALTLTFASLLALAACTGSEPVESGDREPQGDCVAMLGEYPPDTIVMEGVRPVDVPFTSWSCPGYDSDTFAEQLPTLTSAPTGEVTIEVEFRDDPVFEIRAQTKSEEISLDGEIEGESLTFRLPVATEHLWVRLCTSDGRCANYEADVEP
jgi:hypothetical protein